MYPACLQVNSLNYNSSTTKNTIFGITSSTVADTMAAASPRYQVAATGTATGVLQIASMISPLVVANGGTPEVDLSGDTNV